MDPKPVNHISRNSQPFVFWSKVSIFQAKTAHTSFLTKNISTGCPAIHFWTFFPAQKCFIFGPFSRAKYVIFGPKNTLPTCSKNSFCSKLDLNQPKTRGKCLLIEPNRFFSKRFRKDSSDNGLISNKMTNICFFMFGWKTNQWDPASEWNDFVSQASKKVLLWLQTLYLSRPGL